MIRLPVLSLATYIPLEVQETIKKYIHINEHMYYKYWREKAIPKWGYTGNKILVYNEGTVAYVFNTEAAALRYTIDNNITENFYLTTIGDENPEYIWVDEVYG